MLRVLTLSTLFPSEQRPNFGGFVGNQTAALAARPGVEVRVVAPVGLPPFAKWLGHYRDMAAQPLYDQWQGLTVDRPRFRHWPGLPAADPAAMARILLPQLRALRASFPFDLIDAEFFFPDGPAAVRLGKALDCPVSIKALGSDVLYWGAHRETAALVRDAGRAAMAMLAVSAHLRSAMVRLGMPEERILVHYTGLHHHIFRPGDQSALKAGLGVTGALVVTVGTLNANKGQALVIQALARLPGVTLALIGEGPSRAHFAALARELGVADRVRFLGSVPPEQVATWLGAADVMALPSASEGIANAWVEALACGTPIVIADAGGARELVDRPEAGVIVPRTPQAVAEAISQRLENPRPRAEVAAAAARFSWERNAEILEGYFRKMVADYRGGSQAAAA